MLPGKLNHLRRDIEPACACGKVVPNVLHASRLEGKCIDKPLWAIGGFGWDARRRF
jgi:hypothetical protein